jgi:hypothetical protein
LSNSAKASDIRTPHAPAPRDTCVVPLLGDDQAKRITDELEGTLSPEVLRRWLGQLLADRRGRSALIQSLSRQIQHLRKRIRQAGGYLDGLTVGAMKVAAEPWPGKLPCPRCGAPVVMVLSMPNETRPGGHELVRRHPDGVLCSEVEHSEKPSQPPQ